MGTSGDKVMIKIIIIWLGKVKGFKGKVDEGLGILMATARHNS